MNKTKQAALLLPNSATIPQVSPLSCATSMPTTRYTEQRPITIVMNFTHPRC